jgi:hypothetical protein
MEQDQQDSEKQFKAVQPVVKMPTHKYVLAIADALFQE